MYMLACPPGFKTMDGKVSGNGLILSDYNEDLEICADDCKRRSECKSFEHNGLDKCKLLAEDEPKNDFNNISLAQFCRKIEGRLSLTSVIWCSL